MKDIRSMLNEKNVGVWDQRIRIGSGIALSFAYLAGYSNPIILIAAALLLVSGARKSCFIYSLINFSSCSKNKE